KTPTAEPDPLCGVGAGLAAGAGSADIASGVGPRSAAGAGAAGNAPGSGAGIALTAADGSAAAGIKSELEFTCAFALVAPAKSAPTRRNLNNFIACLPSQRLDCLRLTLKY